MIYVFLAEGFEEIEALTLVDVLRRAELDLKVVGIKGREVTGSHGITVISDIQEKDLNLDDCEMIVLPGGLPGTLNLEKSPTVKAAIKYAIQNDKFISAICAAPSILGHMGLLEGKKAVSFPSFECELTGRIESDERVCVDDKLITAVGAGAAMEWSLKIVEVLKGEKASSRLSGAMLCK